MDTEEIAEVIVEVFKLNEINLSKYSFTAVDLIHALIELESTNKASIYLDISDNILEHILYRKLRKFFPDKERAEKWSCHILRKFDLRKCPKCREIKSFDSYHIDKSRFTGYSVYCAMCSGNYSIKYRFKNKDKVNLYSKLHYLSNQAYYKDKASHRRAQIIKATPIWADKEKILEVYEKCPPGYHVDHIVPLNSGVVCGLHVEYNLQHLSAKENLRKSNKFISG